MQEPNIGASASTEAENNNDGTNSAGKKEKMTYLVTKVDENYYVDVEKLKKIKRALILEKLDNLILVTNNQENINARKRKLSNQMETLKKTILQHQVPQQQQQQNDENDENENEDEESPEREEEEEGEGEE